MFRKVGFSAGKCDPTVQCTFLSYPCSTKSTSLFNQLQEGSPKKSAWLQLFNIPSWHLSSWVFCFTINNWPFSSPMIKIKANAIILHVTKFTFVSKIQSPGPCFENIHLLGGGRGNSKPSHAF